MENKFYRDNLEAILAFTGGRHILTVNDVRRFTGIKDNRTLHRRFPFNGHTISAPTLARSMAEGATA